MLLTSIETTPNPNSMKLNLDQPLGFAPVTYSAANISLCPAEIAAVLGIAGVKSVFACNNFLTVNKDPRADWQSILDAVTGIIPGTESEGKEIEGRRLAAETSGQAVVQVQTFRGIPIQVKVCDKQGEKRVALEARFSSAATLLQEKSGADYLKERYWADWGVRYGSADEIAAEVVDEIQGTMSDADLARLVEASEPQAESDTAVRSDRANIESDDWHMRLLAVQELGTDESAISTLIASLADPHQQVRRMAAAALGATGNPAAVEPLCNSMLNDSAAGVRRTAGDALSDLGEVAAQPSVCLALSDTNKLVRWRAARFIADLGTGEALPYLKKAADDAEFEVRLEVEAAIARITGGKQISMPMWKKILQSTESDAKPLDG